MADNKYAAYICSGCGIGDAMKVPQLEAIAKKEGKMAVVKSHPFLCNAEGVQTIKDDIANEAVTHVCIAACSRRAKTEAFQTGNELRSKRVSSLSHCPTTGVPD